RFYFWNSAVRSFASGQRHVLYQSGYRNHSQHQKTDYCALIAITHKATLGSCNDAEFITVKKYISQLCLDDNALEKGQFIIARCNNEIVGFGRLRTYDDCQELCSLGVIEPERMKGIGRALCKALIAKKTKPLYLVAIIPEFFIKLGFDVIEHYPLPLEQKKQYCESSLCVP